MLIRNAVVLSLTLIGILLLVAAAPDSRARLVVLGLGAGVLALVYALLTGRSF